MVGVRIPTHNTLKTTTMTKEQFINKWAYVYNVNDTTNPYFVSDLEAVIATEIAKVQEAQPQPEELKGNCSTFDMSKLVDQPQPTINAIEEAYERGKKIRHKNWLNGDWIQKHKETKTIDNHGNINSVYPFAFIQHPEKWELYTEPTEQPAKPFDRERFEAMFRAVIVGDVYENALKATEEILTQLDAYYASKEKGGANE